MPSEVDRKTKVCNICLKVSLTSWRSHRNRKHMLDLVCHALIEWCREVEVWCQLALSCVCWFTDFYSGSTSDIPLSLAGLSHTYYNNVHMSQAIGQSVLKFMFSTSCTTNSLLLNLFKIMIWKCQEELFCHTYKRSIMTGQIYTTQWAQGGNYSLPVADWYWTIWPEFGSCWIRF